MITLSLKMRVGIGVEPVIQFASPLAFFLMALPLTGLEDTLVVQPAMGDDYLICISMLEVGILGRFDTLPLCLDRNNRLPIGTDRFYDAGVHVTANAIVANFSDFELLHDDPIVPGIGGELHSFGPKNLYYMG
jgi:hypothetical protein